MEFRQFIEEVKEEAEKLYGTQYYISIQEVLKNNNEVYAGLAFQRKEQESSRTISPVLYLESYYELYLSGILSAADAARRIYASVEENQHLMTRLDMDFTDFESLKDKICFRLVNRESNRELLNRVPFVPYCDLAVEFCLYLGICGEGRMTAVIQKEQMNLWETDVETLYKLAGENTPRIFPAMLLPIEAVMGKILQSSMGPDYDGEMTEWTNRENGVPSLYVLSNRAGMYGAAAILYEGVLRDFAEKQGTDLLLLPSSIHEVLLLPYKGTFHAAELEDLVRSVNESAVLPGDVLSDHVYRYSRETDTVCLFSGNGQEEEAEDRQETESESEDRQPEMCGAC